MMAFPSMLVEAAEKAEMKVPDPDNVDDNETWDKNDYPHFWVFCQLQLGRPIEWGEHWDNAKIIAGIPLDKLKAFKFEDFLALGLKYKSSM